MTQTAGRRPAADGGVGRRYVDPRSGDTIIKVFQGDFYVTGEPREMLSCILGSCVAACLRDPTTGVGGMNHFLLPDRDPELDDADGLSERDVARARGRYGSFAMDFLIQRIVAFGGRRGQLEAKVFGGAAVLDDGRGIGAINADFVENYLSERRIPIVAHDLRGRRPTLVRYRPWDGRAWLRHGDEETGRNVAATETRRRVRVHKDEQTGSLEVFD
jgi:chemotaxis protein CheD